MIEAYNDFILILQKFLENKHGLEVIKSKTLFRDVYNFSLGFVGI